MKTIILNKITGKLCITFLKADILQLEVKRWRLCIDAGDFRFTPLPVTPKSLKKILHQHG